MTQALKMKLTSLTKSLILNLVLIGTLNSCGPDKETSKNVDKNLTPVAYDLPQIIDNGVLRVITSYSPTGYFIYKGQTMGFEYELLKKYADHIDVELEVIPLKNNDSVFVDLNNGIADIAAANLTITEERLIKSDFTKYICNIFISIRKINIVLSFNRR